MDTGRPVYIEGSDFGISHQETDFINYFGSTLENDFTQNVGEMIGVFGSCAESYEFLYSSAEDLNYSVDAISPTTGSAVFYSDGDYLRIIQNATDTYRTICSTPILGGFVNSPENTKADLMGSYLGFLLDLDGAVRGFISDAITSELVENAIVTVGGISDTTDANGVFSIEIEPGTYELTCGREDYEDYTFPDDIVVNPNEDVFIFFDINPIQSVNGNAVHQTSLLGSFPNPFSANTNILYNLKNPTEVTISIFNIRGQKVKTILSANHDSGDHIIIWNGKDELNQPLANGIYFYNLEADNYSSTKKMILMR
jgi:hypothetical protein